PALDDADGSLEDPDFGSIFVIISPYVGGGSLTEETLPTRRLYTCPSDPVPNDPLCQQLYNPVGPPVNSYLVNGYFVWGLTDAGVGRPAETIIYAERRSQAAGGEDPFCDDIYHPWFYPPL